MDAERAALYNEAAQKFQEQVQRPAVASCMGVIACCACASMQRFTLEEYMDLEMKLLQERADKSLLTMKIEHLEGVAQTLSLEYEQEIDRCVGAYRRRA